MFTQRLLTQARQIHRGFLRLVNESLILMGSVGSSSDWLSLAKSVTHENENAPLERDYFNLHKLIVVVTSVGKVSRQNLDDNWNEKFSTFFVLFRLLD